VPSAVYGTRSVPSAVYGTRSVPTTLELSNLFLRGRLDPLGRAEGCHTESSVSTLPKSPCNYAASLHELAGVLAGARLKEERRSAAIPEPRIGVRHHRPEGKGAAG
jgi:hypothetical protein